MAESLLESELFGHEPGAFTGATQLRRGCFERADGGTLFLDELGTTSARLQEKLLRLVEYGEFERLGGQRTLQVDVRLLAATHADLPAMAARGEFRHDLLDRLSFDVVHLPPLRQRPEDIPELAEHFATRMSAELGWPVFPGFSQQAQQQLRDWPWPGNVRELKNTVERSVHRWADSERAVDQIVFDPFTPPWAADQPDADAPAQAPPEAAHLHPATAQTYPDTAVTLTAGMSLKQQLATLERQLLQRALRRHGQRQKETAEALGLRYDQLRGLMRKHGLRSRSARSRLTPSLSDEEA
jgi:psp operon transcriptional activator